MEKIAPVQEKAKVNDSAESNGAEFEGATLKAPSFSLQAGTAAAPNGDGNPVQKKDDPLSVDKGQVTFDAEGNDTKGSTWYSRHIHWPGTASSGVTVGRGYDMGNRSATSIKAHMTSAGITGQQATLLAGSAGKKGADAKKYVADYRAKIGDISQEQQKKLFEIVYVEYEAKAKGRASKFGAYAQQDSDKPFMLTPEQYDALNPIIKELLVDLTYRGDYKSSGHAAYSKINPILKAEITDKEKMVKLKALLNTYKDSLAEGHFMIHRTNQRIALLDSGISGATSSPVNLEKTDPVEKKETAAKVEGGATVVKPDVVATEEKAVDGAAPTNDYASAKVWDKHSEARMVGMHPSVAASARALINKADKELGIKLRVPPQGGFRSFSEQDALKKKGVSTVGGGYSFHNYGMAIDVVEIKDGAALWNNPRWAEIGACGKSLGFEWGGDWTSFVDKPHFQMTFGYTTKQLLAREKGEDGFVDLGDKDDNALKSTDSAPAGKGGDGKDQGKTDAGSTSRVPAGRLIGEDVGLGGVNNIDDVKAVKAKLLAIGVLTTANASQYAGNDAATMGKLIKMYQRRIFKSTEDGLMSAGGTTETRLIAGVKGTDPQPKPKADVKAEKEEKVVPTKKPAATAAVKDVDPKAPNYNTIATRVYNAMYGWGTDEDAVYSALALLKKNSAYIAAFKKIYKARYSLDIVTQIKSEFSNSYLFGNQLDKALSYLSAGTGKKAVKKKEPAGKKDDGAGEFKTIDNVMGKEDWRTQNPNATNQAQEDSESGWTACKYVSEKMVYRALYDDLPDDFKRADVINAPGKYDYIVGGTGAGEFLSVQKEDKTEVKNIVPKKHKQSTFNAASSMNVAIEYLSGYLAQGIPVVVGVDHTFNRSLSESEGKTSSKNTQGYNEGTTDHFVTVVGQGVDDQGRRYFKWFDPGTQNKGNATSDENRLVEVSPGVFQGSQPWGDKTYTMTMVVMFKKDLNTYQSYVKQNIADLATLKSDFKNKTGEFAQ